MEDIELEMSAIDTSLTFVEDVMNDLDHAAKHAANKAKAGNDEIEALLVQLKALSKDNGRE